MGKIASSALPLNPPKFADNSVGITFDGAITCNNYEKFSRAPLVFSKQGLPRTGNNGSHSLLHFVQGRGTDALQFEEVGHPGHRPDLAAIFPVVTFACHQSPPRASTYSSNSRQRHLLRKSGVANVHLAA